MELSERCIAQLEKEGYDTIYEEQLPPGAPFTLSVDQTTLFVTEGSLLVHGLKVTELRPGDRYQPEGGVSTLKAGPHGCQLVVGE